jgi:type I restriction enzyme, S subunit
MSALEWKPYPEYKTTEFSWIGKIPKHWSTCRVKNLFELSKEKVIEENPQILSLTKKGIKQRDISNLEGQIATTYDGYHRVNFGDIVLNPMDLRSGFVDSSPFVGIISPAYTILKPKIELSKSFYGRWFQKHYLEVIFWPFGKGVSYEHRWTLGDETLLNFPIVKPPLEEQQKISRIINNIYELTSLIESKLLLEIDLIKEKRLAFITQVVTKGLNPDVGMKESGIRWIGEIPEHWKVSRLKYHSEIKGRIGFRGYTVKDLVEPNEGALTLGATHITRWGKINLTNPVYISWEKYYESPEIMLSRGNILIVQRGSSSGKIGYISEEIGPATINPSLVVIKNMSFDSKYINFLLKSDGIQKLFTSILGNTAIPMISQEQIGEIPICIPPPQEIKDILKHLNHQILSFDQMESSLKKQINKLNEYRTAIITEAVTGKIDVRSL